MAVVAFGRVPDKIAALAINTNEQYPAGEPRVRLSSDEAIDTAWIGWDGSFHSFNTAIYFLEELHDYVRVIIPYLPGARQDRPGPIGGDVLNLAKRVCKSIDKVSNNLVVADIHSDKAISGLYAGASIHNIVPGDWIYGNVMNIDAVVAPDKGSVVRAATTATRFAVPVLQFEKERDEVTGSLTFTSNGIDCTPYKRILVVDDICDGGGTFIPLAESIHASNPHAEIILAVTHGLFTKGINHLKEHYSQIITTNTMCDRTDVTVVDITDLLMKAGA